MWMSNHCVDVICLACGANYCERCGDRYDLDKNGQHDDYRLKIFIKEHGKEEWRHCKDEECRFCKSKRLYSDPW